MTNSDLISKLHNFKKLKLNQRWSSINRELLLAQVSNSGAESLSVWKKLLIDLNSFSKVISRPVYALGVFVLLFIVGSLLSQQVLVKAKPNNSLYIARIIAENVKVNTTINSNERNKLAAQYALVHAQDISSVLANPKFNTPANKAQVAKLSTSFNQEVDVAKSRINTLAHSGLDQASTPVLKKVVSKTEPLDFSIADSFKNKQGISVSISKSSLAKIASSEQEIIAGNKILKNSTTLTSPLSTSTLSTSSTSTIIASSTNLKASSSLKLVSPSSAANKILDEAQTLFNSKNYSKDHSQVINKLKEVENIIK